MTGTPCCTRHAGKSAPTYQLRPRPHTVQTQALDCPPTGLSGSRVSPGIVTSPGRWQVWPAKAASQPRRNPRCHAIHASGTSHATLPPIVIAAANKAITMACRTLTASSIDKTTVTEVRAKPSTVFQTAKRMRSQERTAPGRCQCDLGLIADLSMGTQNPSTIRRHSRGPGERPYRRHNDTTVENILRLHGRACREANHRYKWPLKTVVS